MTTLQYICPIFKFCFMILWNVNNTRLVFRIGFSSSRISYAIVQSHVFPHTFTKKIYRTQSQVFLKHVAMRLQPNNNHSNILPEGTTFQYLEVAMTIKEELELCNYNLIQFTTIY